MSSGTRVGTVIEEKYRLDKQIGRGSMGAVYRGTQLMVDRSVAVKLLHPTFAGHDKIQARFEVEAKAIARLNHPNCITLYDFGYSEDLEAFYTVVEFIDGVSLGELVNSGPSMVRVVEWMRQTASALGHAHHHGILHRDLKPENIMLATMTDGSEMVKVLDFGIAQIMKGTAEEEESDEFESDRITRVGEVFGTPPYMSPEQCESARDLTPAADLYSLGIIFYELLEGNLPFFADTPVDIMRMHLNEPPPPMERAGLPESLESIVLQMLAKDPETRPESGDQIVQQLEAIPDEALSDAGPVARAPGDARESDPTLMSAPPESSDTIIVDSEAEDAAEEDVGDASEIYELKDIVDDPSMLQEDPANIQPAASSQAGEGTDEASADATGSSPSPDDRSSPLLETDTGITAGGILDTGAQEVKALANQIAAKEKKMLFGVIATVVLTGAAMVWIIVEYEPFSMADEDEMSQIGEYVAEPHTDDVAEEPIERDDTEQAAAHDEEAPREFVVSDADEENAEEEEEDADEEEAADEAAQQEAEDEPAAAPSTEPSSPPPTRRDPQPEPTEEEAPSRQPPRLGVDDEPSDDAEEEEQEQRGPPRLGL